MLVLFVFAFFANMWYNYKVFGDVMDKMTEKELKILNKQKTKQYVKQLKSEIFDIENELSFNDLGEAQVICKVGKAENVFNKYDIAMDRTINDSLHDYLLEEAEIIPLTHNLEICMQVDNDFTEESENQVRKAVKNHFSFEITSDLVKMKKNRVSASLLYILGFICIVSCPFVNLLLKDYPFLPFYESMLLLAWFFLWEATGLALFDRSEIRTHRYNLLRLYNARISFFKTEEPKPVPTEIIEQAQQIVTEEKKKHAKRRLPKHKKNKLKAFIQISKK